jgi:hypothetical protein
MPARTASGRLGQASTTAARSPLPGSTRVAYWVAVWGRIGSDDLTGERFLPFDQIDDDPARAELDRRLIVDVLGLPSCLCDAGGPVDLLRQKIAGEPPIRADKRTRLVFTADGEANEPR